MRDRFDLKLQAASVDCSAVRLEDQLMVQMVCMQVLRVRTEGTGGAKILSSQLRSGSHSATRPESG